MIGGMPAPVAASGKASLNLASGFFCDFRYSMRWRKCSNLELEAHIQFTLTTGLNDFLILETETETETDSICLCVKLHGHDAHDRIYSSD